MRISFLIAAILAATSGFSQNGRVLKDTGLQKLKIFEGTWIGRNNPGSGDNTSARTTCRWSANGQFLVCDQVITNKDNKATNNLAIYSYDSAGYYKLSLVGIPGMAPFSTPVISRQDTLIYPGEYIDHGEKIYSRTLNVFLSPTYYQYFVQWSKDKINWTTAMQGTSLKVSH